MQSISFMFSLTGYTNIAITRRDMVETLTDVALLFASVEIVVVVVVAVVAS